MKSPDCVTQDIISQGHLDDFDFDNWIRGDLPWMTSAMVSRANKERANNLCKHVDTNLDELCRYSYTPDVLFWNAVINGEIFDSSMIHALKLSGENNCQSALRRSIERARKGRLLQMGINVEVENGAYPFAEIYKERTSQCRLPRIDRAGSIISINPFYIAIQHSFYELETARRLVDVPAIYKFADNVSAALNLIDEILPGIGIEILSLVRYIVPLVSCPAQSYSGSHSSLPGIIFTSSQSESVHILAEMILHEALHSKLFALQNWDGIFSNNRDRAWNGSTAYSPWRRCLRPLQGVLHGAFVFTGVSLLWMKLSCSSSDLAARRAVTAAAESILAINQLPNNALTQWGVGLVASLRQQTLMVLDRFPNWLSMRCYNPTLDVSLSPVATIEENLIAHQLRHRSLRGEFCY